MYIVDFHDSAMGIHMQGRHDTLETEINSCDINFIKKILINSSMTITNEIDYIKKCIKNCSIDEIKFYNSTVKVES